MMQALAAALLCVLCGAQLVHAGAPVKPRVSAQAAPAARNEPKRLSKVEEARLIACSNKAQGFYDKKQYPQSESQFVQCLQIQPGDPNTLLSLAGVQMELNKLDDAKKNFESALPLLPPGSSLAAYAYSRLGDIHMKLYRPKEAGPYYKKALELDSKDINAQVGLGKYYEAIENWKDAAEAYRAGLKLDPINPIALKGLRRAEPHVMTDPEILDELKLRRVIPPVKNELDKDGRTWFQLIRTAENYNALEYLRGKLRKVPPQYYIKKTYPDGQFRMLLTWAGYSAFRNLINKDVIEYFNSKKVSTKFIFKIKSYSGKPMFNAKGELTTEGMEVYFLALAGRKYYVLPWEDPPDSLLASSGGKGAGQPKQQFEPDTPDIEQAKKEGHEEITQREYDWLRKATDCSEETLKESFDLRVFHTGKGGTRYFLHTVNYPKNIPYSYVVDFRAGKKDAGSSGKGLFGTTATPEAKLCGADGTLVDDDVN